MKENEITNNDVEQIERILRIFMALPAEKKEIVLKEANKILKNEK